MADTCRDPLIKMSNWALTAIENAKWAIKPDGLSLILSVASKGTAGLAGFNWEGASGYEGKEALAAREGIRTKTAGVTVQPVGDKRVGHMEIVGPIFRRANMMTDYSGASDLGALALSFNAAVDNPGIDALVLDMDTPGGEVTGVREFAKMVADSPKPVVVFNGGQVCSAGEWIAAASKHIVIDPTAEQGSIGVIMTMRDTTAAEGTYRYVSSNAPNKVPDPSKEEDGKRLQAEVDALGQVFAGEVAQYRGVSQDKVEKEWGKGGTLLGQAAVDAGMADSVGTLKDAFAIAAGLAGAKAVTKPQGKATMENEDKDLQAVAQIAELTAAVEELRKQNLAFAEQAQKSAEEVARTKAAAVAGQAERYAEKLVDAGKLTVANKDAVKSAYIAFTALDERGETIGEGEGATTFAGLLDKLVNATAEADRYVGAHVADSSLADTSALPGDKSADKVSDEEFAAAQLAKFNAQRGHKESK